ncbi:MAG: hypothetical protein JRF25_13090 [Deltaproteobacteria bacterium]|nr:hypothetical protein [Deltaproteobacteria bacterium]
MSKWGQALQSARRTADKKDGGQASQRLVNLEAKSVNLSIRYELYTLSLSYCS